MVSASKMADFTVFFRNFYEMGPFSKDFFDQNRSRVLGFLVKK